MKYVLLGFEDKTTRTIAVQPSRATHILPSATLVDPIKILASYPSRLPSRRVAVLILPNPGQRSTSTHK